MKLVDQVNGSELYANRAVNDENGNRISTTYVTNNTLAAEKKTITDLIPAAATTENQLADKAYVDFNTEQLAAKYLARDVDGNPFLSYAEFSAPDVVFYYAGEAATPTKNDYVLINGDESVPEEEWLSDLPPVTRYWYTGTSWSFQYLVNNSPLNATQMAAVNSGITKSTVEAIDKLPLDELLTLPTDVNEYMHDQKCIQFDAGDNIAMVILDELANHTYPYSCKFMAANNGIVKELEQRPPDDEIFGKTGSTQTDLKSLGGILINVYCMGGSGGDVLPNYTRFAYVELSTQARNTTDVGRFKWWCRLANNTVNRPQPNTKYTTLHWQKALTNDNYGYATFRTLFTSGDNIVEKVMTDFSSQLKPCHFYYASPGNDVTSTMVGLPTDVVDGFQLHAYTSEGDLGTLDSAKWKGQYHFELIGHNSAGKPVKFLGYLNYTSTSKPSSWPTITWSEVITESNLMDILAKLRSGETT